jgi:hypothetical protein
MRSIKRRALAGLGVAIVAGSLLGPPALAVSDPEREGRDGASTHGNSGSDSGGDRSNFSFAVIGDVPYGAAEIQAFPSYIQDINAHKELSFVAHLGDIKNGSTQCTDEYFAAIRKNFDTFTLPLVYTPGDNEWTDCHRTNNGAYNPLERLAQVRKTFFPKPGTTLGEPMKVKSQDRQGFPENINFTSHGIAVAAVNIPGSNNSMLPWSGRGNTSPTAEQVSEVRERTASDIQELTDTFRKARENEDRAVVVMTQADMFDPTVTAPTQENFGAFKPLVQTLIRESNAFGGPVYLINGDSHLYNQDHPLAAGSLWLNFYGQDTAAKNLTRVTIDGSDNAKDWLKVTATKAEASGALSFEQIPFTHPAP